MHTELIQNIEILDSPLLENQNNLATAQFQRKQSLET